MSQPPVVSSTPTLLGPWRRRVQWLLSLTLLLLPWGRMQGESLLRLDLASQSLHLFGQTLRIQELYLLLLFTLATGLALLLATLIWGRLWCGWACPQTTLSDMAEWLSSRLGIPARASGRSVAWWRLALLQLGYLTLSLLVAANLLWYFIEPRRFFAEMATGGLGLGVEVTLGMLALMVYLDLAWVRRLLCREFCPYGRIQAALADRSTLTLQRPAADIPRCLDCGACVRVCPMGIDIRHGDQIECINCGRCLDACRTVMARRHQPGLIRYGFGKNGAGLRALVNPRTLLLSLALLTMVTLLVVATAQRPAATLKVAISHTAASRMLADGNQATFFNLWLDNRLTTAGQFEVLARDSASHSPLALKGRHQGIALGGGQRLRLDLALVAPAPAHPQSIEFVLMRDGQIQATAQAQLLPNETRP